ncbi:hypothetical protein [Thioalkalivibrio sp.]|uniref:hypothetical protein n=1 Tax=Thioalkalivibrio sp. TaxID=2093813 RepID=UPI0012D65AC0|nr:hypothetical protein [Thioalkalivibrio sp.]TVP80256.1 MAG: hypothetical protein EA346_08000 [Thioalkalivibrio sp.]
MDTIKNSCFLVLLTSITLVATTACGPPAPDTEPAFQGPPAEVTAAAEPMSPTDLGALQTYDGTAYRYPLRAQYPGTMAVDDGCGSEGCSFSFTFLPQGNALDDAKVRVFLPAGATSAAEQESRVTGPNGLIENAGWAVNEIESGGSEQFPYPWVETVISFSSELKTSGYILLGETSGQAVEVLLLYPAEMAKAFWPNAQTVLESLEFEEDLLPLTPSNV